MNPVNFFAVFFFCTIHAGIGGKALECDRRLSEFGDRNTLENFIGLRTRLRLNFLGLIIFENFHALKSSLHRNFTL